MGSHSLPLDSDATGASWHDIEELLDQIARIAKSTVSAAEFYRLLLDRLVPAIGASGGAIWTSSRPGELCLEYQIDLTSARPASGSDDLSCHQSLIEDVLRTAQPRMAPPRSGESVDDPHGNPTDCWLIFHPLGTGLSTSGVIELVQRRGMTVAEGRRYLRVLAAAVELADDFHRNCELVELRQRERAWGQHERFAHRVHRSLDADQTAFLIANEGRRILGCDRVSVLIRHGTKCRAAAISGVDSLDRRAKVVRLLESLAASCAAGEDPLWYCEGSADVPVEIERPLHAYLDESQARVVSIVPLYEPTNEAERRPARAIGVLVAEQFQASADDVDLRQRVTAVAGHCGLALSNALVHSRLPLARLGRMLAKVQWLTRARQLPKTVLALMLIAATVAALSLVPADFDIEARGELQPQRRRDVFASDDGVVSELRVDHGRAVRANEPLVVLRKPELDLEFRRVAGEMQTAAKRLAAVQAERLENAPQGPETRRNVHQLTADEEELKELLKGLAEQHEILDRQRNDLIIRGPIDGQALTWNLKPLLEARPVQRGQSLLTVADLDGPWVIELHLADDRTGHVLAARDERGRDLDVSFALSAEPGTVYQGRIADVALATELDEANGATVLVTVDFDRRDVQGLRPGATVIAKIHCGRRAVGYVWLHDLFEAVQSRWWW
jgi:multidrug efflux pump subunit AcrA (membrane-fusion protein)